MMKLFHIDKASSTTTAKQRYTEALWNGPCDHILMENEPGRDLV